MRLPWGFRELSAYREALQVVAVAFLSKPVNFSLE